MRDNVRFLCAAFILLSLSCVGASAKTAKTRVETTERNFQARKRPTPLGDGLTSRAGHAETSLSRSGDRSSAITFNHAISTGHGLQAQTSNPIDDAEFFVRQHYIDFLNRQPDPDGLAFWTNSITRCGDDPACVSARRVGVSHAFFVAEEFRQTGFLIYRVYKASLGLQPTYNQYFIDRNENAFDSHSDRIAYTEAFVQRPEFLQRYPATMNGFQFVGALLDTVHQSSKVDLTSRAV